MIVYVYDRGALLSLFFIIFIMGGRLLFNAIEIGSGIYFIAYSLSSVISLYVPYFDRTFECFAIDFPRPFVRVTLYNIGTYDLQFSFLV